MKAEPLDTNDEAYLVKCCKDNNPAAQKILYSMYAERMMVLCLQYIADQEDAKEVLMDSFLKFFKSIPGFVYRGDGSVRAWLKKITINQCLMHLRKQQPVFMEVKDGDEFPDTVDGDKVLDQMSVKEILKLVHALPAGYRMVFNLYVFEGMNHKEIGELLGISENTSKSQLHRAKAILKEEIKILSYES